jgi:PAS domain S-box-containing protein
MLVVIVAAGGFSLRQVAESDFWVDHTYNVITNLGQIDADIKDAEAAERGYIITGDAEYLGPYNASAANISPTLSKLMQLTADNPTQQTRVRKLGLLIEQRMVVLNDALTARRESGFDAARDVVVTGHGRIVMNEIRAADQEIVDEEYKLLRERTQIRQARLKAGFTAEIAAGALALIALIVAPIDVWRAVRLRQAAEQEKEESAATAHALFQTAAQAIVVVNSGGQIVMANPATEKMLGYQESELTGKAIETLVPEAYRAHHVGQRDAYFHHPENRPMGLGRDLQARRKDGTTFDAEISLSYIQSAHGTLGVAFVSDISQRKADESEIRQQREDLRRLAGRLMTAQDDERRRIARDLHDDLSQKLAYLSMDMGKLISKPSQDWQGDLRAFQRRAADAAESVRHISHQLHPSVLDDIGLAAAVEQYCEEFEERSGIHTHFSAHEIPDSIPRDVANSVYHIFRESLRNVSKHSQTQDVFVTLEAAGGMLQLSVRDEGVGLPIERTKSGASIGIIGMQERAHLVNGTVEIDSKAGEGTDVTVTVPLGDSELNERLEDFGNDV